MLTLLVILVVLLGLAGYVGFQIILFRIDAIEESLRMTREPRPRQIFLGDTESGIRIG